MNLRSTVFSIDHLKRVLDAVRNARSLPPTPLATFAAIQELHVAQCASGISVSVEYTIVQWISEQIWAGLTHQRLQVGMQSQASERGEMREEALAHLRQDFGHGSVELEAWSLLYYHYVRMDLDLDWRQIETLVHQNDRTLRRRLERGLKRLVAWLLESEERVHRVQQKLVLHHVPPSLPRQPLIGRQVVIDRLVRQLSGAVGQPVALVGPGGIGKTSVAVVVTHHLIDALDLDQVVWVNWASLDNSIHPLDHIAVALGLSDLELRIYIVMHRVLIVLDEADSLVDPSLGAPGIQALCEGLAGALLLLTCRYRDPAGCTITELGELSALEARALVDSLVPEEARINDSRWRVVWSQAGGNPQALGVAASLVRSLPRVSLGEVHPFGGLAGQEEMLETLYQEAWARLDSVAQAIWLATWLLPDDALLPELIQWVSGYDLLAFSAGIQNLVSHNLLSYAAESDVYSLHSVTRAFLHGRVQALPDLLPVVHSAIERISAIVMGLASGPQIVRRLLQLAEVLSLGLEERISLLEAVWPVICRRANWGVWKPVIEALIAEGKPRNRWARRLYLRLGIVCRWVGRFDEAERYLLQGLGLSEQEEDSEYDSVQILLELAVCYRSQGRLASAAETLAQAVAQAERRRDPLLRERCLLEMAQIALDEQKPDRVFSYLENCASSARAKALASDAFLLVGDCESALEAAHLALSLSMPDRANHARARALLGRCLLASGRLDEAEDHLALSLVLLDQNQDLAGWARATSTLAHVYCAQGDYDRAIELLDDVVVTQQSLQDRIGLSSTLQVWIEVHMALANRLIAGGQGSEAAELVSRIEQVEMEWKSLVESWKC